MSMFKFTANLSHPVSPFLPISLSFSSLPTFFFFFFGSYVAVVINHHSVCLQPEIDTRTDREADKRTNKHTTSGKQYCMKTQKSRPRCEACEDLIEMDQSRRVSGTPYFQSVIPVASSQPSNRARETDTVGKRVRETERTASLTSDLEGELVIQCSTVGHGLEPEYKHTHACTRKKNTKTIRQNGNLRYLCLPSFVLRRSLNGTCETLRNTSPAGQGALFYYIIFCFLLLLHKTDICVYFNCFDTVLSAYS